MYTGEYEQMNAAIKLSDSELESRLVLADQFEENNRLDIASLYRDDLPFRKSNLRKKINVLSAQEKTLFPEYVDKWIKIGHCTERADRHLFEAAVRALYRYSNLEEPKSIIWCPAPIVAVFAGSIITSILELNESAEDSTVRSAVYRAVRSAVHSAVYSAVRSVVGLAVESAVSSKSLNNWSNYFGGQFWPSWISGAYTSYILDALGVDIGKENELKASAYLATTQSACWWYPTSKVVFVSERPSVCKVRNNKLEALRWDWINESGKPQSWNVK